MLLPIYSALLLGSKDNGDIHFSPESCISYIHFFFFTMHSKKQFLRKSGSSLISRLSVVSFSPKIEQLNNELTLIQAELGTICRNPDFRSIALDHGASAVWPEHTSYLEVSTGAPASLATAQEFSLEPAGNTLDLESRAKGAFLQMLEQ